METVQKFVREAVGGAPINVVRFGLQFGVQIYLARLLSPDVFGIVALGLSVSVLLTRFGQWGLPEFLSATDENVTLRLSTLFWMRVGYALLYAVVVSGIAAVSDLFSLYDRTVLAVLLVLAAAQATRILTDPLHATFKREYKLVRLNLVALCAVVAGSVAGIVLVGRGFSVVALAGFYVVRAVTLSLLVVVFAPRYPRVQFDAATARDALRFGRGVVVSRFLETAEERGDDYTLGTVAGTAVLGNYTIAWKISSTFRAIVQPVVNQGVAPTFARLDDEETRETLEFLLRSQLLLSIPYYAGVAVLAPAVVPTVFGRQWQGVGALLQVLVVAGAVYPAIQTLGRVHQSRGTASAFVRDQLVYVPVLLGGIVVGHTLGGGLGAASAVSAAGVFGFVVAARRLGRDVGLSLRRVVAPLGRPLVGTAVGGVAGTAVLRETGLLVGVPVAGLLVVVSFVAASLVRPSDPVAADVHRLRTALS